MRNDRITLLIHLLFPTFDVISDLAYILETRFHNPAIFICSLIFMCWSLYLLVWSLIKRNAVPTLTKPFGFDLKKNMFWLGYKTDANHYTDVNTGLTQGDDLPLPTIHGKLFIIISFQDNSNLFAIIHHLIMWVLAIMFQSITILLCILLFFVHVGVLPVWFMLGLFLQTFKLMSLISISNVWYFVWTGSNELEETELAIDTEELNKNILYELLFESFPQIIFQVINNTLLNYWSPLAITSLFFSGFMVLNNTYRFCYYLYLVKQPWRLVDIPINVEFKLLGCFHYTGDPLPPGKRSKKIGGTEDGNNSQSGTFSSFSTTSINDGTTASGLETATDTTEQTISLVDLFSKV